MKTIPAFFSLFLFSVFLFADLNDARVGPEDYWKKIMKDQAMPEALKHLFNPDPASPSDKKMDRFVKDFNINSNAIIYRNHVADHETKEEAKYKSADMKKEEEESSDDVKRVQSPGLKFPVSADRPNQKPKISTLYH